MDKTLSLITCAPKKKDWETRFFGNEPRLSELVELYEELGFEVKVETISAEKCSGCTECFEGSTEPMKVIYTREKDS